MEPVPLSGEARAASWRVFALVLLSASYFFQSSGHNEAARFDQMRSVVEHGEWWIDRFAWNTADTIHLDGHTFPNKAPGTTLLGLAPWALARLGLGMLAVHETKQLILITYGLTVLMAALPTALISLLMLRFLARNGWTTGRSMLLALGYGLGTMAFPWATVFFGHQLSAFFAFSAFYLVWSSRWNDSGAPALRRFGAGLLLGFLPVIEYPGAIASGLIGLYALAVLGRRGSSLLIAGALIGILPLPVYNQMVLGDPAVLSYGFYKEGSTFPAHRQGIAGVSWPRLGILREITFGRQRGLFYANPWLLAALVAPFFVALARGLRREMGLFGAIFLAFLLFNSGFGDSIVYWGGAFSFGPRHILIAIPFAVLLAAFPLRSDRLALPIGGLICATILLMLPVAAIDPRLPYEPGEPFLGFYLPLYSRALFSSYPWSTYPDGTLFSSPGAFNLGRAVGMPRDLEILPLALVWAAAAFFLFRGDNRGGRSLRALAATLALGVGLWPALNHSLRGGPPSSGLCQAISTGFMWPYFSDYSLQNEPSENPVYVRAASPSIPLTREADTLSSGALAPVAVTFSGDFKPEAAGWYLLGLEVIGQAALYVDGMQRFRIDARGPESETKTAQLYLSNRPHELVVRYMSDQPVRKLSATIALRDGSPKPLQAGLWSRACP
ncbi:MAG: hypothetical protein K1Y01_13770 [Vicinamibacteria bacterium]|nr:hypothetical protein [Vicinamibacteria bacterium]